MADKIKFEFYFIIESDSTYTWIGSESQDQSYSVNGYELHLKADAYGTFKCQLKGDSELDSLALELEVNAELLDRVLSENQEQQRANLDIEGENNAEAGGNVNLACTPGENC
jgi:hypothetical protein